MSDLLAVVGGPAPAAVLLSADNRLEPVPLDEPSVGAGTVPGAEAAVAAAALARVRMTGVAPRRVAVVVDDDLDGSGREAVVAAVRAAGVAEVVSVPRSIAEARRPPADGDRSDGLLVAAGAALVARDLPADPVPVAPPMAAPTEEPVVEAGPPPGAFAAGEAALDHEIPRHRLSPLALAVVVVLLLGAAAVAYLVLAGDDRPRPRPGAGYHHDHRRPGPDDDGRPGGRQPRARGIDVHRCRTSRRVSCPADHRADARGGTRRRHAERGGAGARRRHGAALRAGGRHHRRRGPSGAR